MNQLRPAICGLTRLLTSFRVGSWSLYLSYEDMSLYVSKCRCIALFKRPVLDVNRTFRLRHVVRGRGNQTSEHRATQYTCRYFVYDAYSTAYSQRACTRLNIISGGLEWDRGYREGKRLTQNSRVWRLRRRTALERMFDGRNRIPTELRKPRIKLCPSTSKSWCTHTKGCTCSVLRWFSASI